MDWTDFPPKQRDKRTGEILLLWAKCHKCQKKARDKQNAKRKAKKPRQKRAETKTTRAHDRKKRKGVGRHPYSLPLKNSEGDVSRIPMAKYLFQNMERYGGITAMSDRIGVDPARVRGIIYGWAYTWNAYSERKKISPVDYIKIETVDRWLNQLGEPPDKINELYPLEEYWEEVL